MAKSAPLDARDEAFAAKLICVLSVIELSVTISDKDATIVMLVDSGAVLTVVVILIEEFREICVLRFAVVDAAELTVQLIFPSEPAEDIGLELIG